jgi:hypothetical protein
VEFGMLWILAIRASALCMAIIRACYSFEINPRTTTHDLYDSTFSPE